MKNKKFKMPFPDIDKSRCSIMLYKGVEIITLYFKPMHIINDKKRNPIDAFSSKRLAKNFIDNKMIQEDGE